MLLINVVFIELIAYGFFRVKYGDYSRIELQTERKQTLQKISKGTVFTGEVINADTEIAERETVEIIHPYFGYAIEGREPIDGCVQEDQANPYACIRRVRMPEDESMPKRGKGVLNVALLGGSVAVGTVNGTINQYYQKLLSRLPEYKGRKVNLHLLAAGGFRQPQSLMMLNYYQTLGAEYDIVIALDGFNEVAVAGTQYKHHGVHPVYPRSWKHRVADKVSPELIKKQARKVALENKHSRRAKLFSSFIFRNSATMNLIWKVLHGNYQNEVGQITQDIEYAKGENEIPKEFQYEALGPMYEFSSWEDLFEYNAKLWANSTLVTKASAQVHGGKFFHFLQPNQYIEGAKPVMPDFERKIAIAPKGSPQGGYGRWYVKSYPYLKEQQQRLIDMGVNSVDLTYLYKDEPGDIYIDSCCHVNSKGSAMIVEAIVNEIHRYNTANSK